VPSGTAMAFQCPDGAPPPCRTAPRDTDAILVRPIVYRGPPAQAWLADATTELIRIAVDNLAGWRVVPPAEGARATTVITGNVVVLGEQIRLHLELADARTRRVLASSNRSAVLGVPTAAIDSAAVDLARERIATHGSVGLRRQAAEFTTLSQAALRAYLAADRAWREGRVREAVDSIVAALNADSMFGLARYRLYVMGAGGAAGRVRIGTTTIRGSFNASSWAWQIRDHLPPRQRDVIETVQAMANGRPDVLLLGEALAARYPDDPDAQYTAGETGFHCGFSRASRERGYQYLRRALALDSALAEAYTHVVEYLAESGDTAQAFRVLARARGRFPGYGISKSLEVAMRVGLRGADPRRLADSMFAAEGDDAAMLIYLGADDRMGRLRPDDPGWFITHSGRIYETLGAAGRPILASQIAATEQSILLVQQGRVRDAWRHVDSMNVLPGSDDLHRDIFTVFNSAETGTRNMETRAALAQLDTIAQRGQYEPSKVAFLRGRWAFASGDTAALDRAITSARALNSRFSEGMEGWRALLAGDSAAARLHLRSAIARRSYGWEPEWPERAMAVTLAELDLVSGDPAAADRDLELLWLGRDGISYAARTEPLRWRIALARGDTATARRIIRQYLQFHGNADPEYQPQNDAARRLLATLEGR
jgi:hypothetical protein